MKTRGRLQPDIYRVEKAQYIKLDDLKPHENIDSHRVLRLKTRIEKDGILKRAIAVDIHTRVILDGHHRLAVLKQMRCRKIPVTFVDYSSPFIEVTSLNGLSLTKSEVVRAGLSGSLYPPKTSRHMVRLSNETKHISAIEERVNVPLLFLKQSTC